MIGCQPKALANTRRYAAERVHADDGRDGSSTLSGVALNCANECHAEFRQPGSRESR